MEGNKYDLKMWIGRLVLGDTAATVKRLNSMYFNCAACDFKGWWNPQVVYYNAQTEEATFMGIHFDVGSNASTQGLNVFSLDNDKFEYIRQYPNLLGEMYVFDEKHGFPIDDGWAARGGTKNPNDPASKYFFFKGSPRVNQCVGTYHIVPTNPVGGITWDIISIGDIDGDGIPDHAIDYSGSIEFVQGSATFTSINEVDTIVLNSISPQPIRRNGSFRISINADSPSLCNLSLYDVQGRFIEKLYDGLVDNSTAFVTASISGLEVSVGTYVLRQTVGSTVSDYLVLITE